MERLFVCFAGFFAALLSFGNFANSAYNNGQLVSHYADNTDQFVEISL